MITNLGSVQFSIDRLNYNKLSQNINYDWQAQGIVNQNPNLQITGFSKSISINGTFYPYHYGGLEQIHKLESLAAEKKPQLLTINYLSNKGKNMGYWVIEKLHFDNAAFLLQPQKIDFEISIQYYGN